jgi:cysteine-S-conjugate beta-lyase
MTYDFDTLIDRRSTESVKWRAFPADVSPMFVADMDFRSPEPVVRALVERATHGVFGYPIEPPELRPAILERLERLYGWKVAPEAIVFMPGVINGFNLTCHAVSKPGDAMLIQTPVYQPFFGVARNAGLERQENELLLAEDGSYSIDYDAFEAAITPATRMFLLCNPHNPVGRVYRREELARVAEICLRHKVVICSDEIHGDLVFRGHPHIPVAALDEEIGQHTVTLMAPSKTYNIAGLDCSFAVIPNAELRMKVEHARQGILGGVNLFGLVAAAAAYTQGQPWLDELLLYLEANRDLVYDFTRAHLPGVRMAKPEGTYLAWLDCREVKTAMPPCEFFLKTGKVALSDGYGFSHQAERFARMNFGCPRSMLLEALERMQHALETL